jgi:hypothetical protein
MNLPLIKIGEGNLYPDAGVNAPEPIKQLIDRFRALPEDERDNKPLLYWLLGSGTPHYKMSKYDSKYTGHSQVEDETCENCQFIYYGLARKRFICSQISGPIEKEGWCRLWKTG